MTKLFYCFLLLFIISCATHKIQPKSTTVVEKSIVGVDKETVNIFLIGDAGKKDKDGNAPKALRLLEQKFSNADQNDLLLFLGDNIYPNGFPTANETKMNKAEKLLKFQTEVAQKFPGKTIFIPGNHDWYSGIKGLKIQENKVEEVLGKHSFLPQNGCPLKKVNLSDDIVLLVVDSHWYLTNWNKQPTINDDCDLKSRARFLDEFRSEIKKARGKTTLIAIHHPLYSNGPHGGQYSLVDNLIPLPIIGNLKNIIRSTSGISNADLSNHFYNELRKNLIAAAQENDHVIFLSGHEHNLQYIHKDNITQIISGSGANVNPTKIKNKNQFGFGGHGFAVLNIHNDQSSDIQFFDADSEKVIFRKTIREAVENPITYYSRPTQDSIYTSVYSAKETQKSGFYKFLWGDRYRTYYSKKIRVPIVELDTLFGGLKPVRMGGGNQTRSLRLRANDGREFVMRAVEKSATQYIQASLFKDNYMEGQFDDTASEALVKDVFTGAHPFISLVVGPLSDAAGVYHLNPQLLYIPKQNALEKFNALFGDELYLLEEHASEGHTELADGGFTGEIISTYDMLAEIQADEDVVVDQQAYIRARLFDMLIGDWDRHQDQWRWMQFKEGKKSIYRPLPRDRDQAFSIMSDGFLLSAAVALVPQARLLRKYSPNLKDVKGINIEPYPLDMALLTDLEKDDWDLQAKFIQDNLTDEAIEIAFSKLPIEVQDETIEKLKSTLKQRKSNLLKISDSYYKLISKFAVITGTNKDDYIEVTAEKDGVLTVSIFRKKGDEITDRFHHRTFYPKETKEIWIYGLDDDDTFVIKGKSKRIKLRLVGGQNNDGYRVQNGKNIAIYDYKTKPNDMSKAANARIKLTDDYKTNVYDFKKLRSNFNQLFPAIGFNPDDGLKVGVSDIYTRFGFERNPFSSQHKLGAMYYFATQGYELYYKGEFAHLIGKLNFVLDVHYHSPNFSLNFFGYGNETNNFDDDFGMDYNRVKTREFSVSPGLVWNSGRGSSLNFIANFKQMEVHQTYGRFVFQNPSLPNYLFEEMQFAGLGAGFEFSNYDNAAFPTMGMGFKTDVGFNSNLDQSKTYGYLNSEWRVAYRLIPSGKLVLASTIKGQVNFGDDFEFFQAATIGGKNGLRGYRNERFSGKQSFFQNTDIRYSFTNLKTPIIPVKIGLYGGFDYGRIWLEKYETSKKWHNSYGGGFFINGADLVSANLGVFNSKDGVRVAFGFGFGF